MGRPVSVQISVGSRQGHLTIVRQADRPKSSHRFFECLCDCGKTVVLRASHLYPSRWHCSQQCRFLSERRAGDLTGMKFSRWLVVEKAETRKRSFWRCRCECGKEKIIGALTLRAGHSRSCGCLLREMKRKGRTDEEMLELRRRRSRLANRANPARVKAQKIKYETKRDHATPAWLTQEDWDAMNALYEKARKLTRETGIVHQVDHIIPIWGKTVSGLHVPDNLQILTRAENVSKSNRYADL